MRVTVVLLCFLAGGLCPSEASFFDSLPIVSQFKSLVQVISGDEEGAKRTQENFLNTAVLVSQIKSAVQAAQGDMEGARETQVHFANNLVEVVDSTPVIGHVKGVIHIATGDEKKGEQVIKGATSTTGAVIGGLLGGPGGAIVGGTATDALITGIDSAVNEEFRPFGSVDYVVNFNDKDAGEHFDQIVGSGMDIVGGAVAKKKLSKDRGGSKLPDSPDQHNHPDTHYERPDNRPNTPEFGAEQPPRERLDFDSIGETTDVGRRGVNLPDNYRNRLEWIDFRDVNDVGGTTNCYFCTIAAMKVMSATELMKRYKIDPSEVTHIATIDRIISLYQRVGWRNVRVIFEGDVVAFRNFVDNNVASGQSRSFALAFRRYDGTGHVVMMRVWKDPNSSIVNYLTTDYQRPVSHPNRFSMWMPENAKIFYIILPES